MRTYGAEIEAAIASEVVMPREFLEIWAKNRGTGATVYERLWSDNYDITADVIDPDDGSTVSRSWQGVGGLVDIDAIPRVANLTIPRVNIMMLAIGADIDRIVRTYDVRLAPVRLWRGWLDTTSRKMVAPAEIRFVGFIDEIQMPTGAEGQDSHATMTCVGHSQEMTRSSTDTRSHESQQRRHAGDDFFKSAAAVADQTFFWGQKQGKVAADVVNQLPPGVI